METNTERYTRLFGGANKDTLREFFAWHKNNPHIFQEFSRLAREYKAAGHSKCSHWLLANVIRWNNDISGGTGEYKIKNLYIAYLARCLIYKDPSFEGFFTLAEFRS